MPDRAPEQAPKEGSPLMFGGNRFDVILRASDAVEGMKDLQSEEKRVFMDATDAVMHPPMEPIAAKVKDINVSLQLRKLYPELARLHELSLISLQRLSELNDSGSLVKTHVEAVYGVLSAYVSKKAEYDALWIHSQFDKDLFDEATAKTDDFGKFLQIEERFIPQWNLLVGLLREEIPKPVVKTGTSKEHREFVELLYGNLNASSVAAKKMIVAFAKLRKADPKADIDPEERLIILSSLLEYGKSYEFYLGQLQGSHTLSDSFKAALAMVGGEALEEGGEWLIDKRLPLAKRLALGEESAVLKAQLAVNGIKGGPSMLRVLLSAPGTAGQLMREAVRVVSPDSLGSLIFYMYYLYISEDKTKAFLMYSTFMVAGKGLDALAIAIQRVPGATAILSRVISAKGLHPVAKFAIIMAIAWFGQEAMGKFLDGVERRSDPLAYDIAGNALGGITAPLDVFASYGVSNADPMYDQMKYLTYEPGIARNTGLTAPQAQARIGWWDNLVEDYARQEKNPIKQKLMRLQSIHAGPGGFEGWSNRQAFSFYRQWSSLRSLETSMTNVCRELGLPLAGQLALSNSFAVDDMTGDRNVRRKIVYEQPYSTMYAQIENAENKAKDDPERLKSLKDLRKTYAYYERLARETDEKRSDYVRLGIYSPAWIEERVDGKMPKTIERGLFAEMAYGSAIRDALRVEGYPNMTKKEFAKFLAKNVEQAGGPPNFLTDPFGWVGYFAVSGDTWDQRIDEEMAFPAYTKFIEATAKVAPNAKHKELFASVHSQMQKQEKFSKRPHEGIAQLGAAYADIAFDGRLQNARAFLQANASVSRELLPRGNTYVFGEPSEAILKYLREIPPTREPVILSGARLTDNVRVDAISYLSFDPTEDTWEVRTRSVSQSRIHYARGSNNITGSHSITESFTTWRLRHPEFALQVAPQMREYRLRTLARKEQEEQDRKNAKAKESLAQYEAMGKAKAVPGLWFSYPSDEAEPTERRHEYVAYHKSENGFAGYFLFLRTPDRSRYPAFRNADSSAVEAVGDYRGARIEAMVEKTKSRVWLNRMKGDYVQYLSKKNLSVPAHIFRRALTLPIPNKPQVTIVNILSVFVRDISEVQNDGIETVIVEQYAKLKTDDQRRVFLWRLEAALRAASGDGDRSLSSVDVHNVFNANSSLLTADLTPKAEEWFEEGLHVLGVPPGNDGVYRVNRSSVKGVTPLFFHFDDKNGWMWSPGNYSGNPLPDHWYSPHTVNIPWTIDGRKGYASPAGENMPILFSLQKFSKE